MHISQKILSDITVYTKYAKYLPDLERRETWEEIVDRNKNMHLKKFPHLKDEIEEAYQYVYDKRVLPSMRSLQFGGKPIDVNQTRIFNCSYAPVDHPYVFAEAMFLLLSGVGFGYSVQRHHVDKLPEIRKPSKSYRYLIGDSIEGWADAVKVLLYSYFGKRSTLPDFDFRDIREKGALLVTSGGKAPGAEPLKDCLHNIKKILDRKNDGEKLRPIEVHDIMCYIADAVLAGGIRRSAMISLFSMDDLDMLTCKSGDWWETNPHRSRANNSAVVLRHRIKENEFMDIWEMIKASGSGEPAFFFSNNQEWGTNPCCVSGDTWVLTSEGARRAKDLVGEKHTLLVNGVEMETNENGFWKSGTKEVYKLETSHGYELVLTHDHRLLRLKDGAQEWVELKDIHLGDEIMISNHREAPSWGYRSSLDVVKGYNIGFLIGGVDIPKEAKLSREMMEKLLKEYNIEVGSNKITEEILMSSKFFHRGFLGGLFDASSKIHEDGGSINKVFRDVDIAKNVQNMLLRIGIKSHIVEDIEGLFTLIIAINTQKNSILEGLVSYEPSVWYNHVYSYTNQKKQEDYWGSTVVKITKLGEQDVYDVNVPEASEFCANGIRAHNCEIGLRPNQMCNLTEINAMGVYTQEELNNRSRVAAFIGTLQASYTDFHYLREVWKRTCEKDALLGVSMTGIASGGVLKLDLEEAAQVVLDENERVAELIGINKSARTTCVKPAGTTSLVLGTSSGIHAWHNEYYIRTLRLGKDESIYWYLRSEVPDLIEDDITKPHLQAILSVPQKAPEGAITRFESSLDLLDRVKMFNEKWVARGHRSGDNAHNVSVTISVKDDEWDVVGKWMWDNRNSYTGISVLPFSDHVYKQAPFQDSTQEEYNRLVGLLHDIDLTKVTETEDLTDLTGELACAGGACLI